MGEPTMWELDNGSEQSGRGQSYKDFYTLGQIYKCALKYENNALIQNFDYHCARTLHTKICIGLHLSSSLKRQFRHFLQRPMV